MPALRLGGCPFSSLTKTAFQIISSSKISVLKTERKIKMAAKDKFHNSVKKALQRDGWTITADPLYLEFGGVDLYIDLAAEKMLAAEKEGRKIAVEVKSFIAPSLISEFHTALGQFINYRTALQMVEPDRQTFLAVPEDTYKNFFTLPFTQTVTNQQQLKIIVYDSEKEVIVKWCE